MGFPDYFLIVWDFIRFARSDGVSVGPGRGSAAGSLVAYCLHITDLDPIRYSLLFERFLNPGRKTLPDVDVDFAVAGRERVINYVAEKYGRRNVAQIITFGKMQPKAAIKDAGRVMGIPYGVVDRIAKLVPEVPKITFDACMKPGAELRRSYDTDEMTQADRRHGAAARGRRAQRLDPRRRGRDRRPAADRVPAAAAEGHRLRGRDPVLDERRRGPRPAEDGLPRPAQPGRDRPRRRGDRAVAGRAPRHGRAAARRHEDVRDDGARRGHRRVPVRVVGHARRAAPREADRVRGPDRAQRPLPARADAVHPRLRQEQGRPVAGEVRGRAPAAAARGHARDLHLPGAVHGDRQGRRRVHARRGRRSAQGDRQEGREPDGVAEGEVHPGLCRTTARPRRSGGRCGRRSRSPPTTPSTRPTPPATRSSPTAPPTCARTIRPSTWPR